MKPHPQNTPLKDYKKKGGREYGERAGKKPKFSCLTQ
jgi:hypothetical protein